MPGNRFTLWTGCTADILTCCHSRKNTGELKQSRQLSPRNSDSELAPWRNFIQLECCNQWHTCEISAVMTTRPLSAEQFYNKVELKVKGSSVWLRGWICAPILLAQHLLQIITQFLVLQNSQTVGILLVKRCKAALHFAAKENMEITHSICRVSEVGMEEMLLTPVVLSNGL